MTEPEAEEKLSPLDILARQSVVIDDLLRTVELHQEAIETLRRRVQVLEGVPWPDQEPPGED
ncbi:MAG: hypothetical protein ABSA93_36865 [Streptosporangiaceae bacterium]